jgi:hypothetical protein
MRISCSSLNLCLSFLLITHYQHYSTSLWREEQRKIEEQELGKMTSRALNNLIISLLHEIAGPRHTATVVVWSVPPSHGCCSCISTTPAAFSHATPPCVGAAPITFPRSAGVPADDALRPQRPSKEFVDDQIWQGWKN